MCEICYVALHILKPNPTNRYHFGIHKQTMASEFSKSVQLGLKLSKRIYYGKDNNMSAAPPLPEKMSTEKESYLPTSVMVYAEVNEPVVVDNPDITSYQPYVHGRCDPPALIPLHMHGVLMEVDCYLDTAFVTVTGTWRMHCVTGSKRCPLRIAVPVGEQGSILGVEVESSSESCCTRLIMPDVTEVAEGIVHSKDGIFIKGQIYTLKTCKVYGGTVLSIKVSWSQKLSCQDGQFHLSIPFTFPSFVIPMMEKFPKKEKIVVNVNSGVGSEVLYQSASHPLERIRDEPGKVGFSYEREASAWSMTDFDFSYVSSSDTVGGLLLQSPSLHDYDQREMFCFYLYPGKMISKKVFRKEVVFLVDVSSSMRGSPLENVKIALLTSVSKLSPLDKFNIITFNEKCTFFSKALSPATKEMIDKASTWIGMNFIAGGGTNISAPLDQAIDMVSKAGDVHPLIFLITDGSVENEKEICDDMKERLAKGGSNAPRICTFAIGMYCNHYFLQMLAQIGRGHYEAAFDVDSINLRMERFISSASSVIISDIYVDALKHLDSVEFYPFQIPDLLSEQPLFISGRYSGKYFPDSIEIGGTLEDFSKFVHNVKVQRVKDIPIYRVFARRQIFALTAHAWYSGSKQLEEKVTQLSLHTGVPSEYTRMIIIETDKNKLTSKSKTKDQKNTDVKDQKITFLRHLGIGFGNTQATVENRPPEQAEPKLYETSDKIMKAAANYCGKMMDCCCCMCFIQCCSKVNDQCAVVLTQLCAALACFECISVCCEVCTCD